MLHFTPALSTNEPDPALLKKLELIKCIALMVAGSIAALTLAGWLIPPLGRIFPDGWQSMKADSALAVLLSALSLRLSETWHSKRMNRLSVLLAVLVALLGVFRLIEYQLHFPFGIDTLPSFHHGFPPLIPGQMSPQPAAAFALLGISMIFIRAQKRIAVRAADLLVFALCLVVLVLLLSFGFGVLHIFGRTTFTRTSPQTLLSLVLMTAVVLLRRAENGLFSIFLGHGIGSSIARGLAPLFLVAQFLREIGRARMIHAQVIPEHYATSILASLATVLSFVLLMFLAWRIKSMEAEIHDLTLRDELTGLYNPKGFALLAEQARRLAVRSKQPFSVLFLDVDNLKQTNDTLGHQAGSSLLVETGEMLKLTFRETDVMGRFGGDEFAVAGQFGHDAISVAADRLREACAHRNAAPGRRYPFSFSIGCFTADESAPRSLEEMLSAADKAMYEEKRNKKLPPR